MTKKMQQCRIIYCSLAALHVSIDIFAYHQEHLNCIYSFWCYTRKSSAGFMGELELTCQFQLSHETSRQRLTCITPETVNTVQMLLMMRENIARNMQGGQGIINYPTPLHLVGHFRIIYLDARNHKYQMLKEVVVTNIKAPLRHFPRGNDSNYEKPQDSRCARRDSSPAHPAPSLGQLPRSFLPKIKALSSALMRISKFVTVKQQHEQKGPKTFSTQSMHTFDCRMDIT